MAVSECGFETACRGCGAEGEMEVVAGTFDAQGMRLCEDGFATSDAKTFNTSSEVASCRMCGHTQTLSGEAPACVPRPRHLGIYDLPAWMKAAEMELQYWDRTKDCEADNALALKNLVVQAERYFRDGLAFDLYAALSCADVPAAGEVALAAAERIRKGVRP